MENKELPVDKKFISFVEDMSVNTQLAHNHISNTKEDIEKLVSELKQFGVRKVHTYDDFSKFLDIKTDFYTCHSTMAVSATRPTLVLFDNADFNSTYLISEFNKAMDMFVKSLKFISETGNKYEITEAKKILETMHTNFDIFYIDNLYLRLILFNPYISFVTKRPELDFLETQRNNIQPSIMNINDQTKECTIINESYLGVIDPHEIMVILCEFFKFPLTPIMAVLDLVFEKESEQEQTSQIDCDGVTN